MTGKIRGGFANKRKEKKLESNNEITEITFSNLDVT